MIQDFLNKAEEVDKVIVTGKIGGGCNTCPKEYPLEFKDKLSYREYKISGMCQKCQDEVFGGDN